MKHLKLIALLSLLWSGLSAYGQDSLSVAVRVVDATTQLPISHGQVELHCEGDNSRFFKTDSQGEIRVTGQEGCILLAQAEGYLILSIQLTPEVKEHTFALSPNENYLFIPFESFSTVVAHRIYEHYDRVSSLAGNAVLVNQDKIQRQLPSSLAPTLNMEAGVRMDERGLGGSRRISIRGSALRSPFAVRNIKMYVNGIALTSPDGSSPLELLDAGDVRWMRVLKGAAGSVYGPGNGGVLLNVLKNSSTPHVQTSAMIGSNGLIRNHNVVQYADENARFRVGHVYQENSGFRDQEFNHKQQVTLSGYWSPNDSVQYYLYATHYAGRWGLPGGITWEDAQNDPTQARPFAIANGTHVQRVRSRVGIQRSWTNRRWSNRTSVYVNATDKVNPYGTSAFFNGYKEEQAQGYGARTVFSSPSKEVFDEGELTFTLGAEWQQEAGDLSEWILENSAPGDFKYRNETTSTAWTTFGQAVLDWGNAQVNAGISLNQTVYDNIGESQQADTLLSLDQRFDPGVMVLPRLAVRVPLMKYWMVHVQGSMGASPPSLFEMVNPEDGTFAPELTSEQSLNLEVGMNRIEGWDGITPRPYGFTAYWSRLQNAILPQDEVLFANKGEIDLQGAEAWIDYPLIRSMGAMRAAFRSVAAFQQYTYRTFESGDVSLAGNAIPGLPQLTWSNQLSLEYVPQTATAHSVELTATHRYQDRTPLNDANTAWAPAYHVLDGQLRYRYTSSRWELSAFGGILNATDVLYSNFLQINAFGGRYFNPAPGRSYYSGLSVRYNFSN